LVKVTQIITFWLKKPPKRAKATALVLMILNMQTAFKINKNLKKTNLNNYRRHIQIWWQERIAVNQIIQMMIIPIQYLILKKVKIKNQRIQYNSINNQWTIYFNITYYQIIQTWMKYYRVLKIVLRFSLIINKYKDMHLYMVMLPITYLKSISSEDWKS